CIRSSHMRRPIISISCGAPADGDGSALFPCARERRISRLYWWMARPSFMLILVVLAVFQPGIAQVQGRQQVTLRAGFMLEADRVEAEGESLVLHTGKGRISVERSEVERIEDLPWVVPPAAAALSPKAAPTVPELLRHSATQHGLPEAFVSSVAEAESALRPEAISPKGARA